VKLLVVLFGLVVEVAVVLLALAASVAGGAVVKLAVL
jgi:hypothetical protein